MFKSRLTHLLMCQIYVTLLELMSYLQLEKWGLEKTFLMTDWPKPNLFLSPLMVTCNKIWSKQYEAYNLIYFSYTGIKMRLRIVGYVNPMADRSLPYTGYSPSACSYLPFAWCGGGQGSLFQVHKRKLIQEFQCPIGFFWVFYINFNFYACKF